MGSGELHPPEAAAAHQASAVAMSRLTKQTLVRKRTLRQIERQGR